MKALASVVVLPPDTSPISLSVVVAVTLALMLVVLDSNLALLKTTKPTASTPRRSSLAVLTVLEVSSMNLVYRQHYEHPEY